MKRHKQNREAVDAIGSKAFWQAQAGDAVALDPDVAWAMGAFEEEALSLSDVLSDTGGKGNDE